MIITDGYYTFKKGSEASINRFFSCKEMECKCSNEDCVDQKISIDLINRLTWLRECMGKPLTITSAFRCAKHQASLRASGVNTVVAKTSQHELGNAVDCFFKSFRIDEWLPKAEMRFNSIGIANNFLHLDTRDDKKRRWKY